MDVSRGAKGLRGRMHPEQSVLHSERLPGGDPGLLRRSLRRYGDRHPQLRQLRHTLLQRPGVQRRNLRGNLRRLRRVCVRNAVYQLQPHPHLRQRSQLLGNADNQRMLRVRLSAWPVP